MIWLDKDCTSSGTSLLILNESFQYQCNLVGSQDQSTTLCRVTTPTAYSHALWNNIPVWIVQFFWFFLNIHLVVEFKNTQIEIWMGNIMEDEDDTNVINDSAFYQCKLAIAMLLLCLFTCKFAGSFGWIE